MKSNNKHFPVKLCVDGKFILGGAFYMMDTMGFPLPDFILACEDHDLHPDLCDFILKATEARWDYGKALRWIDVAYRDLGRSKPKHPFL